MTSRFDSIIEALSKAGFINSAEVPSPRKLDFKITEYNLNTDLSFKFDNVEEFKKFLKTQNSEINEERIAKMLNDLNIDADNFFYFNFFDHKKATEQ